MSMNLYLMCLVFLFLWNVCLTIASIIFWVNVKAMSLSTHQIVGPREVFNFGNIDVPDFQPVTDDLRKQMSEVSEDDRSLGD